MKKPLEAAQALVHCFKVFSVEGEPDKTKVEPGRPIPIETWRPVIIALHNFLSGDCESLDEAFGGSTRSYRKAAVRARVRKRIRCLVQSSADDYKRLPKEEKLQGVSPKDFGILEVAEFFGMTIKTVKDIYNGDR